MKRLLLSAFPVMALCASLIAADAPTAPATNPAATAVPVRGVTLFSSGVGFFEHYGTVDGNASTELRFKTNQINDILKSLVLQDTDGGKIGTVTYPSQDPIGKILHSFQIDITNNPSLGDLLNQLRGAKVHLALGAEQVEGTILGLEKKPKVVPGPNNTTGTIEVWYINLIDAHGMIRSIELANVSGIELEDPTLRDELNKALAALAQARDQDKKPVIIHFMGNGERHVRIGYVVETPVWKTSYRLVLTDNPAPATQQAQPATEPATMHDGKLQGWAIVENQTDNDWNNVQLSLVSGRPISFIEDLYQPLYIPRPVVQPELYASLRPQTYEGGMEQAKAMEEFKSGSRDKKEMQMRARQAPGNASFAAAPAAPPQDGAAAADENEARREPMNVTQSVSSLASASKMGELFEYTVGSVTLPRQRSAMIPIITDDVAIEKVSIYNQSVLPRNPLNGAIIKNTTGKNLLQGPITVLDGSNYAGDARIDDVPPDQQRMISYGVDLQVLVDSTKNTNNNTIQTGKIVKGVLQVQTRQEMTQEYAMENKGDTDRIMIIEAPVHPGWKLFDTQSPFETTQALYRFRGKVAAHKGSKLVVKEQRIDWSSIALLQIDVGQIDFYAKNGAIPADVQKALSKAIELKNAMTDTQRQITESQQRINEITTEQGRIRSNMSTVADRNSAYYNRLLTKLNDQETQLEKLQGTLDELRKKFDQERKDYEEYLQSLNVG